MVLWPNGHEAGWHPDHSRSAGREIDTKTDGLEL
jgi:hypothetical protein